MARTVGEFIFARVLVLVFVLIVGGIYQLCNMLDSEAPANRSSIAHPAPQVCYLSGNDVYIYKSCDVLDCAGSKPISPISIPDHTLISRFLPWPTKKLPSGNRFREVETKDGVFWIESNKVKCE